jgi:signal transduction histidine kinase/ActR/RegA family two-component response regulator
LVFSILVLRWKLKYSITTSALTIVGFSMAFYFKDGSVFFRYLKEGGMFYFIGQALFPFIMQMIYTKEHRKFIYFHSLKLQNEKLEVQNRLAEEATQAKSDFLSMMSHEIRTPLNGIVGIVHILMQEEMRSPFQRGMIETLKFSADHLMAVVNDILDFNKINSNHVRLGQDPFDLSGLLKNLEHSFLPRSTEKGLDLTFDIDSSLPPQLIGDQVRLSQILTNLIHNAVKFTEKGFVKLQVKVDQQTEQFVRVYFEVSDSGVGVSEEDQLTIFEVFTQSISEANKSNRGTGLGLAITKELVRLFGSEIRLESEIGKGSRFFFSLDFGYLNEALVENKPMIPEENPKPKANVLVVDDNNVNLLLATTLLKKVNLQFETAMDGQEAVNKFRSGRYDLVLMDLKMPVMNGFEATKLLRDQGVTVPIIALTASAFTDEREKALENGFSAYLVKPFLPKDFYNLIYSFLHKGVKDQQVK